MGRAAVVPKPTNQPTNCGSESLRTVSEIDNPPGLLARVHKSYDKKPLEQLVKKNKIIGSALKTVKGFFESDDE